MVQSEGFEVQSVNAQTEGLVTVNLSYPFLVSGHVLPPKDIPVFLVNGLCNIGSKFFFLLAAIASNSFLISLQFQC